MFIQGITDYSKQGQTIPTGLFAGPAIRDGELKTTQSGKTVGSVSVRAYSRKDGTAAFLTVKAWGSEAQTLASLRKGDALLAAGRLEQREYNGKTYTDLVCDLVITKDAASAAAAQAASFHALAGRMEDAGFADMEQEDGELPF